LCRSTELLAHISKMSSSVLPPPPPSTATEGDHDIHFTYRIKGHLLTWPIWHRLPEKQRVDIAKSINLSTDRFEELVVLKTTETTFTNILINNNNEDAIREDDNNLEDDDEVVSKLNELSIKSKTASSSWAPLEIEPNPSTQLFNTTLLLIPTELILHQIFPFLNLDYLVQIMHLLNKSWYDLIKGNPEISTAATRSFW